MTTPAADRSDRDQAIAETLERWFGFTTLRPLQREAIDATLDGDDALVVMPTGGGKSLCYQLPPLVVDRLTVVVSPLIALMQDQVDGLRLNGIPAAAAHSNLTAAGRAELRELSASGELRLLFVAPERLFQSEFFSWLCEQDIASVAIDEAHCISQWGHDFRPEYRRMSELRDRLPNVPFHAYTATATPRVREDIVEQLHLRAPRLLVGTFDRPELSYRVLPRQNLEAQVAEAIARHPDSAAIVYCISRKDTESLAEGLRKRGVDARAYHAGLGAAERTEISADFRAERLHVVIATVAFGMGIDRSDVRLVVHAAMPKSLEHYQQETGRAGRDGLPAECLLLYSNADAAKWRLIMGNRGGDGEGNPEAFSAQMVLLQHMQRYAGLARCRHQALSEYFGQEYPADNCGACDVCRDELEEVPESKILAQKILSAVARTGQRFGARYIIDVLRGSKNDKVRQRGHDAIPTFGICADEPVMRLGNYIDQLVDQGVLVRSDGEYPTLQLGADAGSVLRGDVEVMLRVPKAGLDARPERRRRGSKGGAAREEIELEPAERELFEALRGLRRELAGELGVPPYVVFSDATLEDLARVRPSSQNVFLTVKGVGQKKLESFGEQFLAAIAEHCEAAGLALEPRPAVLPRTAPPRKAPPRTAPPPDVPTGTASPGRSVGSVAAGELFAAGKSIAEVIESTGRTASTVTKYLCDWILDEQPASIEPWVAPEVEAEVVEALLQNTGNRLKPVFEALDGKVSYDTIRIVLTHRGSSGHSAEAAS